MVSKAILSKLFPNEIYPEAAFFDIDGTLSIPNYCVNGKMQPGMAQDVWEDFCKNEDFPYERCGIPQVVIDLLDFLAEKDTILFVNSQENPNNTYAARAKRQFINKRYGKYFDDKKVLLVSSDEEKIDVMLYYLDKLNALRDKVGINSKNIVLGSQIEQLPDIAIMRILKKTNIFAKLSPIQKARIVRLLKESGNVVGYMGDGINDSPSLTNSDVGISVDTAVDIAKESADIILLEKDLKVLLDGVKERKKNFW